MEELACPPACKKSKHYTLHHPSCPHVQLPKEEPILKEESSSHQQIISLLENIRMQLRYQDERMTQRLNRLENRLNQLFRDEDEMFVYANELNQTR